MGTACAVWTDIGPAYAALSVIALFAGPASAPRLLCIAASIGGVPCLRLTS